MEKIMKEKLDSMTRKEKIKYVVDTIENMKNIIGTGSDSSDLNDIYLANNFEPDQTIAGQNYEDLALAYHCFSRFLDGVTL